jgi:hypothetical protein
LSLSTYFYTDLTPTDSVSQDYNQADFCGGYDVVWPSNYPQWLKATTNGFGINVMQTAYGSSSFDLVVQFSMKKDPTIKAYQTVTIHR